MGRHTVGSEASGSNRRIVIAAVAGVAALALVGAIGAAWPGGYLAPLFASAGSSCDEPTTLTVVADPSIADGIEKVAKRFDERDGACVTTKVDSQDSADTAAVLASAGTAKADVWIPDSTVWVDRMASTAASLGRTAPTAVAGATIASTPVVFAAPASRAAEFTSAPVGWSSILGGTVGALLPDPESSSSSLAGLLALKGKSSAADPRQFAGAVIALGKTIPESPEEAFTTALEAPIPTVVVTTERSIAGFNATDPAEPLVAIYPADGTLSIAYPVVKLDKGVAAEAEKVAESDAEKVKSDLVDAFSSAIEDARTTFEAEGFRDGDGAGELDVTGLIADAPEAPAASDGAAQIEILRSWGVLNLRSRILSVIDVSGSMLEPAAGGLRRIDIFQQAAGGALGKFSGEVELGIWIFSTNRVGAQDWEDVSPIEPLGDPAHAQQVNEVVASLPGRISGDTGLYDTTLAAVQRVRESYDPTKVNSVLLITDGRNDDANGIDLPTLLAELGKINDPLKPVPVIMVGFGPDTDIDAMTQIATSTGGAAYSASKPEDLGLVLVDALSQRTCRPNC